MTPELHDRFVGAVSHLPQLTASALMHVVGTLAGDAGLELAGARAARHDAAGRQPAGHLARRRRDQPGRAARRRSTR